MTRVNLGFNYRVRPVKDESFRGYLLRLISENGFKSINDRIGKLDHKIQIENASPTSVQSRQLMALLDPHLRISNGHLASNFDGHWLAAAFNDYNRNISNIFSKGVRLCPECIREKQYILVEWDCCLITCCIRHKCYLIDKCQACGERITWNRSTLNQCTCEHDLTSIMGPTLTSDSAIYKATKRILTQKSKYIKLLLNAIATIYRPADSIPAKPSLRTMGIQDIGRLIEQGEGLLHSAAYRDAYRQWLNVERNKLALLGSSAIELPLSNFLTNPEVKCTNSFPGIAFKPATYVSTIKTAGIEPMVDAENMGIEAARLKHISPKVSEIALCYQVTVDQIASVLGISVTQVGKLVQDELLEPLNLVKTSRHMYFDLIRVLDLFPSTKISTTDHDDAFLTVAELSNGTLLDEFGADLGTVVRGMMSGCVPSFMPACGDRFSDRKLHEVSLIQFLHAEMIDRAEPISAFNFAKILGTVTDNVFELERNNLITTNHWSGAKKPGNIEVNPDSFRRFMQSYISINRVCRRLNIRLSREIKAIIDKYKPMYIGDSKPFLIIVPSELASTDKLMAELSQRVPTRILCGIISPTHR